MRLPLTVAVATSLVVAALATPTPAVAATGPGLAGTYRAVQPVRIAELDVPANGTVSVLVSGRGGIPAEGVSAATLLFSVFSDSGTASGYLTAYPAGTAQPAATSLVWRPRTTTTGQVVVPPGAGGVVQIGNRSPSGIRLTIAAQGYYLAGTSLAGGGYAPVTPTRIADTTIPANGTVTLAVGDHGGIPANAATAALVVSAGTATTSGTLVAYPAGARAPTWTSTLAFRVRHTVSDRVVVTLGAGGKVAVANTASSSVRITVDTQGYFTGGADAQTSGAYIDDPADRDRLTDAQIGGGETRSVFAAYSGAGVAQFVLTAQATASGALVAYANGQPRPAVPSLHYDAGRATSGLVTVPLGDPVVSGVKIYNSGRDTVHITIDTSGFYTDGWTGRSVRPPAFQGFGQLQGVTCTTISSCVAVGLTGSGTGDDHAYAAILYGGRWTSQQLQEGSGFSASTLHDVSCWAVRHCIAVGVARDGSGAYSPLIETLSGTQWTPSTLPTLPGDPTAATGNPGLVAVNCVSAASCMALGNNDHRVNGVVEHAPFVAVWSAGVWAQSPLPDPDSASDVTGLSCVSYTACVAVGDDTSAEQPRVWRLDGATWTTDLPPVSASGDREYLNAVSCPVANACVAVGTYALALGPFGSGGYPLPKTARSVWCAQPYADVCIAMGDSDGSTAIERTANQQSWSAVRLARPRGADLLTLLDLFCFGSTSCVAVGRSDYPNGEDLPFVAVLA